MIDRREFVVGATIATVSAGRLEAPEGDLFGLIGKITARPGQRDGLIALILEGVKDMPGCISYVVAKDADSEDDIWVTEVWDSAASHAASLKLPAVTESIAKAMPLIDREAKGLRQKTVPIGGKGIS